MFLLYDTQVGVSGVCATILAEARADIQII
jgi:hypothetical protein